MADLVQAINNNYDRFMYCDTDSLHLYGTLEEVKGVNIGKNTYGYWDNELCFDERCEIIEKFYTNFKELLNDKDFVKKLNFSNLEVNQYKIYIKNFETQRSLNESITILYDLIPKLDSLCTQININNEDISELKSFKNMYEENDRKNII